uniref:Rho-GAP domain-containing protein n=1 Tax=Paramoeba aestuarina TaxID=180227 RepID=A0A7S4NR34_9EUKA|mmetsp:Transcript_2325/g.3609  ORF Transcript_2325/g.3609 Transcript_2325/m.3609 type:complete len:616 (+) Transcript_2325:559-2406(+)
MQKWPSKKLPKKTKCFFQEKFRESGQTLDEAQDRYEILTRELESTLSIVCETSSTVIVKSLIAYLEAFHEFHDTCSVWLKNLMETDSIKNWRKYVEEKEEELAKKRAAGCGPSKKVYGNKISELSRFDQEVNPDALPVPTPILRLIEFLNDHCLSVEGIFRLSGNQNEVDIERRKIDAWEPVEYSSVKDAHLVSGLLKKYLRDLPEPLLTYELFGAFLATKDLPENQAVESLNKTMKKLPEVNRATFHAICQLCYNVQRFSDKNKMTPMNLGIVFAPSCLYGKADNPAALELSLDANSVVAFIIEHCDEVFKGEVCAIPKVTGGANAPKTAAKPSTGAKSPFPSTKSPIPATKSPEHTAPAPPPARASEWTEHTTEEGISYWFNAVTGVSTWTDPNPKKQTQKPTPSPLPSATPPNPAPLPFPDGGGGTGGRRVIDASTAGGGRAGMRGSVQVKAAPLPQSSQNAVSPGGGNLLNLGSPSRPNQRGGAAMAGKKRSATVGGGPPPMSSAGRGGGPPRVLPNPGGAPGGGNSAPRTLPNPGGAPPGVGVPPRSSKPNIQQPNYGSTFPGPSKGGTAGAGGGPPGRSLPNPGGGPPPGGMQGAGSRPAGGRPLPPPK